jgi:hypothetical protein
MQKLVKEIVKECLDCGKNRIARHAPYRLLQNPEVPSQPWD